MAQIFATDRDGAMHELEARERASLMEILKQAGLSVEALCGGSCQCATCHVFIDYLRMFDGDPLPWAVSVVSGDVFANGVARHALECGGHLRVGLEDHAGGDRPTNLELVERAVALAREVGRPVASSTEAARLLDLP